mgnify:CR=1 FL=1
MILCIDFRHRADPLPYHRLSPLPRPSLDSCRPLFLVPVGGFLGHFDSLSNIDAGRVSALWQTHYYTTARKLRSIERSR